MTKKESFKNIFKSNKFIIITGFITAFLLIFNLLFSFSNMIKQNIEIQKDINRLDDIENRLLKLEQKLIDLESK